MVNRRFGVWVCLIINLFMHESSQAHTMQWKIATRYSYLSNPLPIESILSSRITAHGHSADNENSWEDHLSLSSLHHVCTPTLYVKCLSFMLYVHIAGIVYHLLLYVAPGSFHHILYPLYTSELTIKTHGPWLDH